MCFQAIKRHLSQGFLDCSPLEKKVKMRKNKSTELFQATLQRKRTERKKSSPRSQCRWYLLEIFVYLVILTELDSEICTSRLWFFLVISSNFFIYSDFFQEISWSNIVLEIAGFLEISGISGISYRMFSTKLVFC